MDAHGNLTGELTGFVGRRAELVLGGTLVGLRIAAKSGSVALTQAR